MKVEDIKKVGVVGSGVMGHGLAINSALWGYPTIMHDVNDEVLQKAMKNINFTLDIFVDEGLIDRKRSESTLANITTTSDLVKLAANSDFITEAIIERSEDKYELFNKLDKLCPPHTIIVSNTSSLVLSDFGRGVKRQDKIAVTHYFSPPAIVPGVEVAKGPGTSDETFNITHELMKKWHKEPIKVLKEKKGYLINRLQGALFQEATKLWAEGVATAEELDKGVRATIGFRMPHEGPLMRFEMAGLMSWPGEIRRNIVKFMLQHTPPTGETLDKILKHYEGDEVWFVPPERRDQALESAYREYTRRLKNMYWSKGT